MTEGLNVSLAELAELENGDLEIGLALTGNAGQVKGISVAIAYDPTELEFVTARLSEHMLSPLAEVFCWHGESEGVVQVDLSVLGTGVTIGGAGDVATLMFRQLDDGYALDFEEAILRDAENEDLLAELEGCESRPDAPTAFSLAQNVPNPFNPVTTIAYDVPHEARVAIRVYDVAGRLVRTLVAGKESPGRHEAVWNGRNDTGEPVGSGVYFCTMEAGEFRATGKMLLLK